MKLEREHVVDELIGDVKTNKFKIGEDSMGIIIDSLINLYSDPIGSIVREVTSNCYDAHREKDLKIRKIIPLQDDDDPQWFYPSTKKPQIEFQEENILLGVGNAFLFRDFGVGLSKKRVEEIYTLFGNSTKRGDNNQIGGYGLGAKSPFSYTDTFYILSRHNGKTFSYMLYRGNDAFHMDLLKEGVTTELNSTEVIIPLDSEESYRDTRRFAKAINNQLMYFENLEFINIEEGTGRKVQLATIDYEDDDIVIDLSQQDSYDKQEIHLMVGRVRYPLKYNQCDEKVIWGSENIPCAIKFDVGEIDLVPSREAIRYTDKTKTALKNKILRIQQNLKSDCEAELASADNWITWLKQASALVDNRNHGYRRSFDSIFGVKSYLAKLNSKSDISCTLDGVELSGSLLDDDYRNNCLFRGFSVYKVKRETSGQHVGGYRLAKTKPKVSDLIRLPIFFQQQIDTNDILSEETRKTFLKTKDFYIISKDCPDGFIQIRRDFAITAKHLQAEEEVFFRGDNAARSIEEIHKDFESMTTLFKKVKMVDYDNVEIKESEFSEDEIGSFESEAERRKRMGKAFMRRVYFKDRWGDADKVCFNNDEYYISELVDYQSKGGILIYGNSKHNDLLRIVAAIGHQAGMYFGQNGYGGITSLDVKQHPITILKVAASLDKKMEEAKFIHVENLFTMKHQLLRNWNTAKKTKKLTDELYFYSIFEKLNSDLYYKWKKLKENHENNFETNYYLTNNQELQLEKMCDDTGCINELMLSDLRELEKYSIDLDLLKHLEFAQLSESSSSDIPSKEVFLALREYLKFKGKAVIKFKKQKKKGVKNLIV